MIRRPPRSTHCISSAASDVYKRQGKGYPVVKRLCKSCGKSYFSGRGVPHVYASNIQQRNNHIQREFDIKPQFNTMKRACKSLTSKNMRISTCEFFRQPGTSYTTIKKTNYSRMKIRQQGYCYGSLNFY
eukprot:TRINITY_DN2550_c0_g1_i2.p3 TRINITY_DN2550_c0_g1~~TRINITY_DN2550_c0_g1_i2.p3  ORF type:complete len:129 (-),score=3.35 TRINITY_DN2550_c0_g1_i2:336-722(-)